MALSPYSKWLQDEEMKLRGTYLRFAVDAEWMLIMVIHQCYKNNLNEVKSHFKTKKGRWKDINELTLDEKIQVCKKAIQKYHPSFFKSHAATFDTIDKLRDVRNKFAHCKIDDVFTNHDKKQVTLHSIRKGFKVESNIYTLSFLYNELSRYERNLRDALNLLLKVLRITYPEALVKT